MKRKFLVLLSTFNGEEYLEELLNSVAHQESVDIKVLVRDDGSTDRTLEILDSYSKSVEMEVLQGVNIGSNRSFQELFRMARLQNFDYLAFCDQDDVWQQTKLKRAFESLERSSKKFYASKRKLINSNGKQLGLYPSGRIRPSFANAIVENVCAGCTTVLSESFYREVVEIFPFDIEGDIDHILYMLATASNCCYFDQESRIYYRVHGGNQLGIRSGYFFDIKKSIHGVTQKMTTAARISKVIENFSDPVNVHLLWKLSTRRGFIQRVFIILRMPKLRQRIFEDVLLRIFLITNRKHYDKLFIEFTSV
jgi:glycosyltransferase involved in cell wall biosynthesis